jgi:hypothetical protein
VLAIIVKKRLFVGLLAFSLAAILGMGTLGWFLTVNRDQTWNRIALSILGGSILVLLAVVSIGVLGLILTLWRAKAYPNLQNTVLLATNILFPVALGLGQMIGIDKDRIKHSFVEVNNYLVKVRDVLAKPAQVLILAPHCLQHVDCQRKITMDVRNCARCGRCPIDDLLVIAENYGVSMVVVTGGTLARKFVSQAKPRAIVAIACERDLTSGIQDTNPLPVLGVLNIRPEGPCFNTGVNLAKVEDSLRFFLRSDIKVTRGQAAGLQ